jgi:hypothetical protein
MPMSVTALKLVSVATLLASRYAASPSVEIF